MVCAQDTTSLLSSNYFYKDLYPEVGICNVEGNTKQLNALIALMVEGDALQFKNASNFNNFVYFSL